MATAADELATAPPDGMDALLDALAPSCSRLQAMLDSTNYTEDEKRAKIHATFIQAVSAGQLELLEWLLATQAARGNGGQADSSQQYTARLDVNARDDNGTPGIVLAAVFGHGETVRMLLDAGADIDATDSRGWSALFWAFQRGGAPESLKYDVHSVTNEVIVFLAADLPLSSFLINRKAKTSLRSNTGLVATDLIRKGSQGEVLREVLRERDSASTEAFLNNAVTQSDCGRSNDITGPLAPRERSECKPRRTPSMTSSPAASAVPLSTGLSSKTGKHQSLPPTSTSARTRSTSIQAEQNRQAFLDLAAESCRTLDIDYNLLAIDEKDGSMKYERSSSEQHTIHEGDEEDACNDSKSSLTSIFDWEECLNTQMLSFSMDELPALLDLALFVKPSRAQEVRNFPANILFLATRYASRYGGEDLLGELLLGAFDRIEAAVNVGLVYLTA